MDTLVAQLLREHKMTTPDEKIMMMARSLHKAKVAQEKILKNKRERGLKIITQQDLPKMKVETRVAICKATTMNGKRCGNKAVCGEFCKRHQIPPNMDKSF